MFYTTAQWFCHTYNCNLSTEHSSKYSSKLLLLLENSSSSSSKKNELLKQHLACVPMLKSTLPQNIQDMLEKNAGAMARRHTCQLLRLQDCMPPHNLLMRFPPPPPPSPSVFTLLRRNDERQRVGARWVSSSLLSRQSNPKNQRRDNRRRDGPGRVGPRFKSYPRVVNPVLKGVKQI
jgi:hypothetical protein